MVPMILGIDPSSTSYIGVSALDPAGIRLVSVRCLPDMARTLRERLIPSLDQLLSQIPAGSPVTVVIEKPPPTARKDTQHAKQAGIGDALGWSGGLVAGVLFARYGADFVRYEPGEWRETLLSEAGRLRLSALKPGSAAWMRAQEKPRPDGWQNKTGFELVRSQERPGSFTRRWQACGHNDPTLISFANLDAAGKVCPICHNPPQRHQDRAELVRLGWKRLACEVAEKKWPEEFATLKRERTERSQAVDQAKIPGLADTCEAAFIALHHQHQKGIA